MRRCVRDWKQIKKVIKRHVVPVPGIGRRSVMKIRNAIRIVIFAVVVALGLAFVVNLLFKIHSVGLLSAEWDAGDALNYVAAIASFIGTIVLGYIAYSQNEMLMRQNNKLQDLEENSYIINNNSMITIEKIRIAEKAHIPVNWEIHDEQIVADTEATTNYVGYRFEIVAKEINGNAPVLVHIEKCTLFCDDKNKTIIHIEAENWCNKFSRIAIHKDNIVKFGMEFIIDRQKKEEFEEAVKETMGNLTVEMVFQIIANKNIATRCKCRSYLNREQIGNNVTWKTENPMVFYYGNFVAKEYEIAGETKREIEGV